RFWEQLALRRQVRSEEHHHEHLAELGRLERERSEPDPYPRAVDLLAEHGDDRKQQEPDREEADRVRERVEAAVVPDREQRDRERGEREDQPPRLVRSLPRVEPVDHREPDPREERSTREERGICV